MTAPASALKTHVGSPCATTESKDFGAAPTKEQKREGGGRSHDAPQLSASDKSAEMKKSGKEGRQKRGDERTEALIRAAAQDVLAKMELERAGYDVKSLLSAVSRDEEESYSEVTKAEETEVSYTEGEGTDLSQESQGTELSHDDGTEVTCSEESEVSYVDGSDMTYGEETEMSYNDTQDGTEVTEHEDLEHEAGLSEAGSAHTHHDEDVFSPVDHPGSSRNSLTSFESCPNTALEESDPKTEQTAAETQEKSEKKEVAGLEQVTSDIKEDEKEHIAVSPGNSEISTMPPYEQPAYTTPRTQSTNVYPPFRSPSSVRAIQMSSPTPSIMNGGWSPNALRAKSRASQSSIQSPRPSTSRARTPSSQNTPTLRKKGTPGALQFKMENPLVLLHVTVLPLKFPYSSLLDSGEPLPESVQPIRETWRLLQDKLGDEILNRGVLCPHPQDSLEVLGEVLLDALELPIRKRAQVLKCGHYLSASATDLAAIIDSSESEADYEDPESDSMDDRSERLKNVTKRSRDGQHVCPTCERMVNIDKSIKNAPKERRYRVKVYASNGLMGAGAWEAAWREMERVDVEIEPFVKAELVTELDTLQSLWTRHLEVVEKREEEVRQQEQEEQQQQQQMAYEQQQREEEYEQHQRDFEKQQALEEDASCDLEQQAEPQDRQDLIDENLKSPESSNESSRKAKEGMRNIEADDRDEIQGNPTELPATHAEDGNLQEEEFETAPEEELPQRQSDSPERLREIYGNGPEAFAKIESARASLANSRPQSRQVHGRDSSFSNGQSTPISSHALAARLHGLRSASPSRSSPEKLKSRMYSGSQGHSSGYGGMGVMPHATVPPPSSSMGGNDYMYTGHTRPYSQDYAHNGDFAEEAMRERLRRRTDVTASLPSRFGGGVTPSRLHHQAEEFNSEAAHHPNRVKKATRSRENDSLLELLIAAFKVAMRDPKNVVILILGILVLFFALKPAAPHITTGSIQPQAVSHNQVGNPPHVTTSATSKVIPETYETHEQEYANDDYEIEDIRVEIYPPIQNPQHSKQQVKSDHQQQTQKLKGASMMGVRAGKKHVSFQLGKPKLQSMRPSSEIPTKRVKKAKTEPVISRQSTIKIDSVSKDEVEVKAEAEDGVELPVAHPIPELESEDHVHENEVEDNDDGEDIPSLPNSRSVVDDSEAYLSPNDENNDSESETAELELEQDDVSEPDVIFESEAEADQLLEEEEEEEEVEEIEE